MNGVIYGLERPEDAGDLVRYQILHVCVAKKAHVHITSRIDEEGVAIPDTAEWTIEGCDGNCVQVLYDAFSKDIEDDVSRFLWEREGGRS